MPLYSSDPLTCTPQVKIKMLLLMAADREHRSIANLIKMLIRDYCGRNGITIQEQRTLPLDDERKP